MEYLQRLGEDDIVSKDAAKTRYGSRKGMEVDDAALSQETARTHQLG
jgi:hypothetical protein